MIIECSLDEFNGKDISSVVLIGAGKNAREILENQSWNIRYIIDSNDSINEIKSGNKTLPVLTWDEGIRQINVHDVIVISPSLFVELREKILAIDELKNHDCYLYIIMKAIQWDYDRELASNVPFEITRGSNAIIPKTIHYFWFSGDPYPDKIKRCIDSWYKYCEGYEIKQWNLENYRTDCAFCNEALAKRSWAFASDYGRCDVLFQYGGIYLDSDVELVRPLDDLLYDEGFMCFESNAGVDPGSGMGAVAKHSIMRDIRERYHGLHYVDEYGNVYQPNIMNLYTDVLKKYGLKSGSQYQRVNGFAIYPPLVFSPYSYMTFRTQPYDNVYAIHHWVSSWVTQKRKQELEESKEYFSHSL